jgi:hypothetical protein
MSAFGVTVSDVLQRGSLSRSSTSSTISTTSTLVDTIDLAAKFGSPLPHNPLLPTFYTEICESCSSPLLPIAPLPNPYSGHSAGIQGKDLNLKSTTEPIRSYISAKLAKLATPPKIVGLLSSEKSDSRRYARSTAKTCHGNFDYALIDIVEECEALDERGKFGFIKERIEALNGEMTITGLIVYFPIFGDDRVSLAPPS